jgi:hypothetical protein
MYEVIVSRLVAAKLWVKSRLASVIVASVVFTVCALPFIFGHLGATYLYALKDLAREGLGPIIGGSLILGLMFLAMYRGALIIAANFQDVAVDADGDEAEDDEAIAAAKKLLARASKKSKSYAKTKARSKESDEAGDSVDELAEQRALYTASQSINNPTSPINMVEGALSDDDEAVDAHSLPERDSETVQYSPTYDSHESDLVDRVA